MSSTLSLSGTYQKSFIYRRNRTNSQWRALIYLSIWLIWSNVYFKLGNITIRVILDTHNLNIINSILCFNIFFFFLAICHNTVYTIIWIGVHRMYEPFVLYFSFHFQHSYQRDKCLSLMGYISHLPKLRGNHRIFVITIKKCKCSIL